jgi:hypothetical protein
MITPDNATRNLYKRAFAASRSLVHVHIRTTCMPRLKRAHRGISDRNPSVLIDDSAESQGAENAELHETLKRNAANTVTRKAQAFCADTQATCLDLSARSPHDIYEWKKPMWTDHVIDLGVALVAVSPESALRVKELNLVGHKFRASAEALARLLPSFSNLKSLTMSDTHSLTIIANEEHRRGGIEHLWIEQWTEAPAEGETEMLLDSLRKLQIKELRIVAIFQSQQLALWEFARTSDYLCILHNKNLHNPEILTHLHKNSRWEAARGIVLPRALVLTKRASSKEGADPTTTWLCTYAPLWVVVRVCELLEFEPKFSSRA